MSGRCVEREVVLDDGHTVRFVYDRDGDDLEIVFDEGRADFTVELTDNIVLRLDRKREVALSLLLLNFSFLTGVTEWGPQSFPVSVLDQLSPDLRRAVLKIITSPPVNRFLKVFSYTPSPTERIPITYVERTLALAWA